MERNNGASHRPSARDFGPIAGNPDLNGSPAGWPHRASGSPAQETGLDYIYKTDKSAASVEEIHSQYFRPIVGANHQVGDRRPDYHLPPQGGRSGHRYWVVDRDKVEYWAKIAGHVIFWGSIVSLTTAIIIGLIFG